MNTKPIFLAAAVCAALSSPARAGGVRLGLGAASDLRDTTGGAATASLATDQVIVEAGVALAHVEPGDGTVQRSTDLSIAVLPVVARRDRVALEIGLRAATHRFGIEQPGGGGAEGRLLVLAAPVRIDVAAASWLSVYAEADVELLDHQLGETTAPIALINAGAYLAGFTVWF